MKMAVAQFDNIDIPLVYSIETARQMLADRRRTVSGKYRQDIIKTKRQWTLLTQPLTMAQRNAIISHLESAEFQAGDFHLDEFGVGVTVKAYMRVLRETRSLEAPDRRSLELMVIEK